MKKLLVLIAFLLIPALSANAQESQKVSTQSIKSFDSLSASSSSKKGNGKKNKAVKNESCEVDCKTGETCRMKDKFIDADGDGLNDNRCNGMGLGLKKRKGKMMGKMD